MDGSQVRQALILASRTVLISFGKHAGFITRVVLFVFYLLIPATTASAHANLVVSTPENGALLQDQPSVMSLEFSEDLDPGVSRVRLLNAISAPVVNGPGEIDPDNPRVLKLDLPTLPDGSYIAVWQVKSAVDGHITNGTVSFSIGKSDPSVSLVPTLNKDLPDRATPGAAEIILRTLGYLSTALLGGAVLFKLLVWQQAFLVGPPAPEQGETILDRILRHQAVLAAAGLLIAAAGQLIYQFIEVGEGDFTRLFSSPTASWLVVRMLLTLTAGMLSLWPGKFRNDRLEAGLKVALYLVVLAAFSLSSHTAAWGSPLPVILDGLHLLGMGAWLGGLLPLFILLRAGRVPAWQIVPHFSKVALASVGMLALTGTINAVRAVQSWDSLVTTSYGITLLIKLAIFGALFLLGAMNLLFLTPRLKTQPDPARTSLSQSVRVELALGTLLLISVGFLTGTPPSFEARQAVERLGMVGSFRQADTKLTLWVAPRRAGENEIAIDISPSFWRPKNPDAVVLLRLEMIDRRTGQTQVETKRATATRYVARGSYLSIPGTWKIKVILRQAGENDITHDFVVDVRENPNELVLPNPVPANPETLAAAKGDYEQYCLPCHGLSGKGDGPIGLTLNPRPADLTLHAEAGAHTDGQLFYWISQGYPDSAMPAFEEYLSEEQRWSLVNYIHTLAPSP